MSIMDDIRTKSSTKDSIKNKDIQKADKVSKEDIRKCKSTLDRLKLGKQGEKNKKLDKEAVNRAKEEIFKKKDEKDKGLADNRDANKFAKWLLEEVKLVEPKITSDMKNLERNGAKLEGLDYRLKGEESLTRKIETDAAVKGKSFEEVTNEIGDCVRYTLVTDKDNYSEMVTSSLEDLEKQKYSINKLKNTWGNDIYQGINTNITSPEGIKMELQFHTKESYNTKEVLNHKYYEITRDLNATEEERDEANRIMKDNQAKVSMPEGAKELKWSKGE